MRLSSSIEEKKLPSLLGNERGCGAFERGGEKEAAITDEGSSDATSRRRISYALALGARSWQKLRGGIKDHLIFQRQENYKPLQ